MLHRHSQEEMGRVWDSGKWSFVKRAKQSAATKAEATLQDEELVSTTDL